MATIRTRQRADGSRSYTVSWRDAETKAVRSRTFHEEQRAIRLKEFLDSNGNSFTVAKQALAAVTRKVPLVQEVVVAHIEHLRKPQEGTISKYRRLLRLHIQGTTLGTRPVDLLTRADVAHWLDNLVAASRANQPTGQKLGHKSKANIHALLSAALAYAVGEEIITRNVAKGQMLADKNDAREPVYLSPDDLDMICAAVGERYRLFLLTLCKTGLRYNEATALRKRDVRIINGRATIYVTRAWKAGAGGKDEIGPPKTKKSRRTVACSLVLSEALAVHLKEISPEDLLFTRPTGEYLRNSWFHKYVWGPLMDQMLEDGRLYERPWIHEIRHAHTTHLLQAGRPVHVVQARLGHEDPQTTLRVYSRMTSDDDLLSADALD